MMTKLHAFRRWLTITRRHEWCLPAHKNQHHSHRLAANTPNNLWPSYIFMLNENHNACPREHFPFFSSSLSVFMAKSEKRREKQTTIDQLRGHKTAMHRRGFCLGEKANETWQRTTRVEKQQPNDRRKKKQPNSFTQANAWNIRCKRRGHTSYSSRHRWPSSTIC